MKVGSKPKRFSCYTKEQQNAYDNLLLRQRAYVDYRSQGYNKADSYRQAGYRITKNAGQNAYILEKNNPIITELIETRLKVKTAKDLLVADSDINKKIDALSEVKAAENTLSVLDNADTETLQQIKFFRDIVNGKIKTVKKTTVYDKLGVVKYSKVEETSDIDSRLKARKELDRILGLGAIIDVGKIETGNITINIVDASKQEELEDDRNKVYIDLETQVEEINGEKVIVAKEEKVIDKNKVSNKGLDEEDLEESLKDEFFENVEV